MALGHLSAMAMRLNDSSGDLARSAIYKVQPGKRTSSLNCRAEIASQPPLRFHLITMSTPRTLPPVVYHPAYSAPLRPRHRFPMQKFARLAQVLKEEGLIGPKGLHLPEPASFALLAAAHDPGHVRQVVDAAVPPKVERVIGRPVTRSVPDRVQAAVGGTLSAALSDEMSRMTLCERPSYEAGRKPCASDGITPERFRSSRPRRQAKQAGGIFSNGFMSGKALDHR